MNEFASGILYAEDFGRVSRAPPPAPPPKPAAAPQPTQADIDAACARAVEAAEIAWSASAAERRAEALALLAAGLAEMRQNAAEHAEATAEGLARTVLGLVAGVLPAYCRAHGDAEVRALVKRLAPLVARSGRMVVRVHPSLVETLTEDLAQLDEQVAGNVEVRPANLPAGDVRLAWEDGSLVRDTAAICAALQDGLAQFGLSEPFETRIGSLAHAQ